MKFMAVLRGKTIPIDVVKTDGVFHLTLEDKTFTVNAVQPTRQTCSLIVDGRSYEVGLEKRETFYSVYFYNDTVELELVEARKFKAYELTKKSLPAGPLKITAPMPGKIVKITVQVNGQVSEGDALLVMEAMKMQNELKAPRSGKIKQIQVQAGDAVSAQQTLVILE